jgi:Zn-dependent peptidase ImmA (M78 family)
MSTSVNGSRASVVVHKSIEDLLKKFPNEGTPEKIIRRLAREKVTIAKSRLWTGPPYCPKEFASIFGIKCKEVHHDIDGEGRILLRPNGRIEIEYRSQRLPERQRFTIFHEFAHTLFPDYCEFLPLHHTPHKKTSDPMKQFERLCDVGASELLLPFEDFTADLQGLAWLGFESIKNLRERYHSSIDATIYRMIDLITHIGVAAAFFTDQKGTNAGYGPLWVKHISKSSLFKGYVPSGVTLPSNSVVRQCYRDKLDLTEAVKETWWINRSPRTWLVQAALLPSVPEDRNYPKVVALLFPSGYRKK